MQPRLVKIAISRLETGRKLRREIFLDMPTNEKMLRLVSIGDEIRPALLDRLRARGVSFLLARITDDEPEDPDAIQLYLDEPEATAALPALDEILQPAAVAPEQPAVAAPPSDASESADTVTLSEAPEAEASTILPEAAPEQAEEETALAADEATAPLEETHLEPEVDIEIEQATALAADELQGEEEQPIPPGRQEEPAQETAVVSGQEPEAASESIVAGSSSSPATEELVASAETSSELEDQTAVPPSDSEQTAAYEPVSTAPEEKIDSYHHETPLPGAADREEQSLLKEAKRALWMEAAARKLDAALANKDSPQQHTYELLEELERVRSGSAPPEDPHFDLEPELQALRQSVVDGAANEPLEKIFLAASAAVEEVEKRLEASVPEETPEQSFSSSDPNNQKRAPELAAKVAPLLAHALGYVQEEFLQDLALAALLRFSNQPSPDKAQLPVRVAAILESQKTEQGSPLGDSREILELLGAYLDGSDLSRSSSSFDKDFLSQALQRLGARQEALNPWNQARWQQAAGDFLPVGTFSRCLRAANFATKSARDLLGEKEGA